MKKIKKVKLSPLLSQYLNWPMILSVWLLMMAGAVFVINHDAGIVCAAFVFVYIVIVFIIYGIKRYRILSGILEYAAAYGQVQKQFLKELFLPYAVLDTHGHMLWGNDEFRQIIENVKAAKRNISNIFPELKQEIFPKDQMDVELSLVFKERTYRVIIRRIQAVEFYHSAQLKNMQLLQAPPKISEDLNTLLVLCLYDVTEIMECKRQIQEERMVVGLLYIDNYEESLESVDEVRRSLLSALIERKINKYMQNLDGIIKKLEKDKYIVIFKQKYLAQMQENRFSLLEEVRSINIGNEIAITISIGKIGRAHV